MPPFTDQSVSSLINIHDVSLTSQAVSGGTHIGKGVILMSSPGYIERGVKFELHYYNEIKF